MGLEAFDPTLVSHDLVQDLKWDAELRALWERDRAAVLDRYPLRPEERRAIEEGDFRTLYDLGFHPYLGGQFARLMYGNAAGPEATSAVKKLVASLTGEADPNGG
ncbi:MAG: extradiol ring-cleavage dioxygenase [Acidimicrobiia bacterium]|nr:extradiol ring-cleavage dioxygenase [Acidimicrobiia bacterium]